MVTNPQERPDITWVLNQVKSLQGPDGGSVDTNRSITLIWSVIFTLSRFHSVRQRIVKLSKHGPLCSPPAPRGMKQSEWAVKVLDLRLAGVGKVKVTLCLHSS
ncbi:hypothetical protein SRHO_G00188540 [Serrasalmus rhombeus]